MELQFISATKHDETRGLASALQRQELIEFLLRLAKAWTTMQYTSRTKVSLHMDEFIDLYIKPVINHSGILPMRSLIRKSVRLNELLFDNVKCL